MKCNICDGEGGWYENYDMDWTNIHEECPYCNGTGRMSFSQWFWENAPVRFVEWYGDTFCNEEA